MTLNEIEKLTRAYADARDILTEKVNALQSELEDVKRKRLSAIKAALAKTAEAEARLRAAIEESAEAFARPRTQVFYGVKVGFQKNKGTITWEDADTVVRLIFKHFPENADTLTRTAVTPNKQTLSELPAQDLKRLGVTVEETGDTVVIKPVDGEVEKVVNALLKDAANETQEVA